MHDSLFVGELHSPRQSDDEFRGFACWPRPAVYFRGQRTPFDQFQGQIRHSVMLAIVVDLHDLWMVQTCDGFGLCSEAGQESRAPAISRPQHLEGNKAVQAELPGLIDDAHTSPAEFGQDLIAWDEVDEMRRQLRARYRRVVSGGGGPVGVLLGL